MNLNRLADALEEIPVQARHRDRLATIAEALRQLARDPASPILDPETAAIGLTKSEARIFGTLKLDQVVDKARLLDAMYFDFFGDDEPDPKIIDVFICKIRAKLKKANSRYSIETLWGRGWILRRAHG